MAYNSKAIKTDVNAKPIPQYYNPVTDEYEVLQGTDGAARQVLYGPDGNPISVVDNKLAVRAEELETKIEAVRVLLNSLAGEDFATSAKQAEILAALGKQSTAEKQDTLVALVGASDAAAVSDPAAAGAVIALLKGLLSRLQTLENKIDSFTTGEETVNTELKGSIVKVGVSDYGQTLNTPVGGKTVIEIRPPTGKLWRVKMLRISTPSIVDATSGDHSIGIHVGRNNTNCEILYIKGKYDEWLSVLDNVVFAGTVAIRPATAECQQNAILNIAITNNAPLYLDYRNNTDADATGNIVVTMNYEEETIA